MNPQENQPVPNPDMNNSQPGGVPDYGQQPTAVPPQPVPPQPYQPVPGAAPGPAPYQQPYQQPYPQSAAPVAQDPGNTLAIVSLVLFILGLPLIGIILAIVSKNKTRKAGLPSATLATVSLILNIIGFVISLGIILLLITTTFSGVQSKARNSKRQTDISTLQTQLESYYAQKNHYPSLTELNDSSWRSTNLGGLDSTALEDPSNPGDNRLFPVPTAKHYAYSVTDKTGASCENDDTKCQEYSLTATFEGTVNGQTTYVKTNLD